MLLVVAPRDVGKAVPVGGAASGVECAEVSVLHPCHALAEQLHALALRHRLRDVRDHLGRQRHLEGNLLHALPVGNAVEGASVRHLVHCHRQYGVRLLPVAAKRSHQVRPETRAIGYLLKQPDVAIEQVAVLVAACRATSLALARQAARLRQIPLRRENELGTLLRTCRYVGLVGVKLKAVINRAPVDTPVLLAAGGGGLASHYRLGACVTVTADLVELHPIRCPFVYCPCHDCTTFDSTKIVH